MKRRSMAWAFGLSALLALRLAAGADSGKVYAPDMSRCAGFTAEDAGRILGRPASAIKARTEKLHASLWTCSFTSGEQAVAFSVEVSKSVAEAIADMERYRENLELTAGTAPFKDKLPKGAWSEILGLGDESVWTDINGTLSVRRGNVTIQVQSPAGKLEQIKVVQAFLKKL